MINKLSIIIRNIFRNDYKYYKETLLMFFLVLLHSVFSIKALSDVVSFQEYLRLLVINDFYLGFTFLSFWLLVYIGIIILFLGDKHINITSSLFMFISLYIGIKVKGVFLVIALSIIIISMILDIIESFKKQRGKDDRTK